MTDFPRGGKLQIMTITEMYAVAGILLMLACAGIALWAIWRAERAMARADRWEERARQLAAAARAEHTRTVIAPEYHAPDARGALEWVEDRAVTGLRRARLEVSR